MITIVDYDAGNIRSMCDALRRINAEFRVSADPSDIATAERVIIPGVGEAASAMSSLRSHGLDNVIRNLRVPVLGVCIGMQLMCNSSEEGNIDCLGIINSTVRKLHSPKDPVKIPHMGWDNISHLSGPLFEGINDNSWVYYVHTYAADICESTIAITNYGMAYSAAIQKDNFFGVQFHPEKSASTGERILSNFLKIQL